MNSNSSPNPEVKSVRKPIVMSGKRVSGPMHVGHYWGALRSWVGLQDEYQCYFGAMDWHGMTSEYKRPQEVMKMNREQIAEYIAWGIDPEKSVVFIQSMVPEHLELYMILSNLTPMGWLERVTTWKDAIEEMKQNDTHNLGRFGYPVLQTADIAIYFGNKVPVGQDQVAHLEISREIIRRFNHLYKGKIPEPMPLLTDTPYLVGLDGRKMSSSYNNGLLLTEEEKALKKKVNSMVTDPARALRENPGDPEKCTVWVFHKLYSSDEDKAWAHQGCTTAGIGCGDCKAKLCGNIEQVTKGPREKKKELLNNPKQLDSIIAAGCEQARKDARKNLDLIRGWMKM